MGVELIRLQDSHSKHQVKTLTWVDILFPQCYRPLHSLSAQVCSMQTCLLERDFFLTPARHSLPLFEYSGEHAVDPG